MDVVTGARLPTVHQEPVPAEAPGTLLQPPPPVIEPRDRKLRFRVEHSSGSSSLTWSVIANRNTDDVYVGVRSRMGEMKLTLHKHKWRLALTEQAAAHQLPPGTDRVVTRWEPTKTVALGWQRGVSILIPTSSLFSVPENMGQGRTSVFPAPALGRGLRFDVLLGDPTREDLTVQGVIGEVGRLNRPSGGAVWIIAGECLVDTEYERGLQQVRDEAAGRANGMVAPRGWGWGWDNTDAGPVLLDLGGVVGRPAGPPPTLDP